MEMTVEALVMLAIQVTVKIAKMMATAKSKPFPPEPLIMVLLLSQHKMIGWLTKQISKHESLNNNNKIIKKSEEEELGRENIHDYIRKNDGRIHYNDDY